jgi:tetratricopeptide (TPR) repeat protein
MDDIDDRYLSRWGQSHVLSSWRMELSGQLHEPALAGRNLSYLVAAGRQHEGHRDDFDHIETALTYARQIDDQVNAVTVILQLANALLERGHVSDALEHYNQVTEQAHLFGLLRDEIGAYAGLSICLAKTGRFDEAEGRLRDAHHLVSQMSATPKRDKTLALLLLNRAWLAGQRGRYQEAWHLLREGSGLA